VQSADCQLFVQWDNTANIAISGLLLKNNMTAPLADSLKAKFFQPPNGFFAGNSHQVRH
jgi:hypothetical protein